MMKTQYSYSRRDRASVPARWPGCRPCPLTPRVGARCLETNKTPFPSGDGAVFNSAELNWMKHRGFSGRQLPHSFVRCLMANCAEAPVFSKSSIFTLLLPYFHPTFTLPGHPSHMLTHQNPHPISSALFFPRVFLAFALILHVSLGAAPYGAGKKVPLPDFDRRPGEKTAGPELGGQGRQAAVRNLAGEPPIKVDFDKILGAPRLISTEQGFLRPAEKTGPPGPIQALSERDPYRGVKSFVRDHGVLFGHGPDVLESARIQREYVTAHSGLRTVTWEQQLDGVPVFEGLFTANLSRGGDLVNLSSRFVPNLATAAERGTPNRAKILAQPPITAIEALAKAAESIGDSVDPKMAIPIDASPEGAAKRQRFRANGLKGESVVELVWVPMNRSTVRLAWRVHLTGRKHGETYRLLVDAQSGGVLVRHCLTSYLSGATYRVYTHDSPSPFSPGLLAPSAAQPPIVPRELMTLSALSTNASPNGWIDDGANELRGNNVDAHLDRDDDDVADLPRPQGFPNRVFDFPLDLAKPPSTYGSASIANLFYWNNWMHDQLYELGFTEAAGNFQKTNFNRGGLGNDAVQADAQDGGGLANANFSTPPDGIPGRMQMYIFDAPTPDRDGSFDVEIILHEYTHGLSGRLVGAGVGITALQTAGMGEGWSDFYALALLSEAGDSLDGNYAFGAYAVFQEGNLPENYYFGVRHYPYTTNMTRNPSTFKDIDPLQEDKHKGIPRSGLFGSFDFADEVHHQGEIWCSTLWDARANLINKLGFSAGHQLILQLVTDGLKLSPPNPNFLEARDAIIQADFVKSGGANREALWQAFARRGMGFSATSPSSSTTSGVVESFDVPDDLLVTPNAALIAFGPAAGPFRPSSQVYTLANSSTNAVVWSALTTALWFDLSLTNGSIPAGAAPVSVAVLLNETAHNLPAGIYSEVITFTNHVTGRSQTRRIGLHIGQPDYFTRRLSEKDPGPSYQTLTFTPDGSESFYSPCVEEARSFPTDPSAGTVLDFDSGASPKISLTDGAKVSLYGSNYHSIYISPNGYITFTQAVSEFGDSLSAHFAAPRISMLFGELDASFEGLVSWLQLQDRVAVTFENVVDFFGFTPNSFQAELFFDGRIRLTYLELGATDGVIGLSRGVGIPPAFFDSDFKRYGPCLPALSVQLSATVSETAGSAAGTVTIPQPEAGDIVVRFQSSSPSTVPSPSQVTVPRGETSAKFNLTVIDDAELDGTRAVSVTASADGFRDGTARLEIEDEETATLTVAIPAEAKEGDGLLRGKAFVTLSRAPSQNVVIRLSSSDLTEVETPPVVIVPAGQTTGIFDLTVVDDLEIDGAVTAEITPRMANWRAGSATITIQDNERRELTVSVRPKVGEGSGAIKAAGTVRIPGTLRGDLTVFLTSSDPANVTVQGSVVIPRNQTSAPFEISVVDDTLVDGPQTVTITASAAGFAGGSSIVTVNDNETPPIPVAPRPAHLSTNNPPNLTLTWGTGEGEVVANGDFETGDLSGWVESNSGNGSFVINDGTFDPDGPGVALAALGGKFDALSQQAGPGRHVIYQDLTIASGAATAVLSWDDRMANYASTFLDPLQQFRVEIRSLDDTVLALAYATTLGDPMQTEWIHRSFDLSAFIGESIRLAFVEEDNLGYFNLHLDNISVQLGKSGETTYDVYFGTNRVPGTAEFRGNTATNRWPLPKLELAAEYYWQIIAKRGVAQSPGPVWQFRVPGIGPLDHFGWGAVNSPQLLDSAFPVAVTALDAFENIVTNFSGAARLGAQVDFPLATLGTNTIPFEFPFGGFAEDARIQAIYLASELGPARRITALALDVASVRNLPVKRFTIRMKQTTLRSYPANPAWERTGWTSVFQEEVSLPRRGWVTFNLATPFDYDGASGLMLDFSFRGSDFTSGGDCRSSPTTESRSIAYQSFGFYADPLSWSGTNSPPPEVFQRIPNVRLASANEVSLNPTVSENFVRGIWSGLLALHDLASGIVLKADDGEGHTGKSLPFDLEARNDLSLELVSPPNSVTVGDQLVFNFVIRNSGPSSATEVVLSNAIPAGLTFISGVASQGSVSTSTNLFLALLGTLPGGTSATVQLALRAGSASDLATNVARILRREPEAYTPNDLARTILNLLPTPSLTIGDATVQEGDSGQTNVALNVNLSVPSSRTVTVAYTSADSSAKGTNDYRPISGTLQFPPGVTSQTVTVPVYGDTSDEADETFTVTLSDAVDATIARNRATVTIADDDGPQILISDATLREGNSGVTNMVFALRLSHASPQRVEVNYSTTDGSAKAGEDYQEASGTAVFAIGGTNSSISVPIMGDRLIEASERFFVTLAFPTNATLGDRQAIGTILNDDGLPGDLDRFEWANIPPGRIVNQPFPVTIFARDVFNRPATNFSGPAKLTAELIYPDAKIGSGTEPWSEPLGTSYEDSRVQIIYLAGEIGSARQITALSLNVTNFPSLPLTRWTLRMKHTLLSSYGITAGFDRTGWTQVYQANESIRARARVAFTFSKPFDYDGQSNLMIDFSFNNSAYDFTDGECLSTATATARAIWGASDSFDGDPLNWSGTTPFPATRNQILNLQLLSHVPVAMAPANSGTFTNGVWSGEATVLELVSGVVLKAQDAEGRFGYASPFDVTAVNDLSVTATVSPNPVTVNQPLTYSVTIRNSGPVRAKDVVLTNLWPAGSTFVSATSSQGVCTAQNGQLVCSLDDLAGGSNATLTVVLNSPGKAGVITNLFMVSRADDEPYPANNRFALASQVNGLPAISANDVRVSEGASGTTETVLIVTLNVPSSQTVSVNYATASVTAQQGIDYVGTSGLLTFPPGTTNLGVKVQIIGDTLDESDETFVLNLTNAVNGTVARAQATGRILDDDGPGLSISPASALEGASGTNNLEVFNVTLSSPSPQTITVSYATLDGSANAGVDYVAAFGTLTFFAGATNRQISISVKGDIIREPDETFFLELSNPTNATLRVGRATGTIVNDDGLPGELDHFAWSGFTSPQRAGQPFLATLFARDGSDQLAIRYSGDAALSAESVAPDTTVGTGSFAWQRPFDTSYGVERVQAIYLAGEIGPARRITAMALNVAKAPKTILQAWTIRMKHTTAAKYGTAPSWDRIGWTTVYQNDETIEDAGWTTFALSTPFDWNGTNNLMVDFSFSNSDSFFLESGEAFATGTIDARSISAESFALVDGDPLNWFGRTPLPELDFQVPDLRCSGITRVPIIPARSGLFAGGKWTGSISLNQVTSNVTLRASDALGHSGTAGPLNVTAWLDSDGDGLPDDWEIAHGANPNDKSDAMLDTDRDGLSNIQEYWAGTNPRDPREALRAAISVDPANGARLSFQSLAGKFYRVEIATALPQQTWSPVGEDLQGTGGVIALPITLPLGRSEARFYRVRLIVPGFGP